MTNSGTDSRSPVSDHSDTGKSMHTDNAMSEIRRVTVLGIVLNVLLSFLKVGFGLIAGSAALVSDGIHSLSDLITDGFVLAGTQLAERPPDDEHPYGHGKFENLTAILIAGVLVAIGGSIIYYAVLDAGASSKNIKSVIVIIAAAVSIVVKEALYQITKKTARKLNSASLLANAWHHRSDSISSLVVLLAGVLSWFGVSGVDRIATTIVGVMIIIVGASLIADNFKLLVETSAGRDTVKKIYDIVQNVRGVQDCHRLRSRFVGRQIFIDAHILVDPEISVRDGHDIATAVEQALTDRLPVSANVLVHIEPAAPEPENQQVVKL